MSSQGITHKEDTENRYPEGTYANGDNHNPNNDIENEDSEMDASTDIHRLITEQNQTRASHKKLQAVQLKRKNIRVASAKIRFLMALPMRRMVIMILHNLTKMNQPQLNLRRLLSWKLLPPINKRVPLQIQRSP